MLEIAMLSPYRMDHIIWTISYGPYDMDLYGSYESVIPDLPFDLLLGLYLYFHLVPLKMKMPNL